MNNNKKLSLIDYENEFLFEKKISKLNISFNRIAFIFFILLFVSIIFSIKIFYFGSLYNSSNIKKTNTVKNFRSDILDINGNYLAKSVITNNIGINPTLVNEKENLLLKLRLLFPDLKLQEFNKKYKDGKFFYIKKKLSPEKYEKVRLLGEKSIVHEQKITRIYPQRNLFSHVIGQIDDENKGVSGLEKSLDKDLKIFDNNIYLTLDTNIQYLIREELIKFQQIFKAKGSAAILMNVNSGEILSLVSLPDFDPNKREKITDPNFINRATKGIYEFGSVFKTFTIAAAFDEKIIEPETEFVNLPKSLTCAGFPIREYNAKLPSNLTVEQILVRSGNIGSVRIAQKVGEEKYKSFLTKLGILGGINFDIEEVGKSIKFNWGKCPLATASFGHGITTTLLQIVKAYSIIVNGGFEIKPVLIRPKQKVKQKKIINKDVSEKILPILRKTVSTEEGTAKLANIPGYEIGGKTGTANKILKGVYSNKKINTFVSIFPTSQPKFILAVMLEEPEINKDYIYEYRDGSNFKLKGSPRNTAGWNSVELAGHIVEKIGPILATKYSEIN